MTMLWKAVSAALIAAILGITLGKQEKDIAAVLTMTVCAILCRVVFSYLEPVLDLMREIAENSSFRTDILDVLIQAVGIGLICELAGMLCSDAGSTSLAKAVQLLSAAATLYLSIPLVQGLYTMICDILGMI